MSATTIAVIEAVRTAFGPVPYPGDPFLQGSFDGEEPYDEIRHFQGRTDWSVLEPAFLDARYCALSFFSEAGFRFFLPAYLVADLQDALRTADPAFHLIHGLADRGGAVEHEGRRITSTWGPARLLNPRRYGALTWGEHARYRLSVFAREEAAAIVAYLRWRQGRALTEPGDAEAATAIERAVAGFWLGRARSAPTRQQLEDRVARDLAEHDAWERRPRERG